MCQLRHRPRLSLEPGESVRVMGELVRQHLDRNLAAEPIIHGSVDNSHAAPTQHAEDAVRAKRRRRATADLQAESGEFGEAIEVPGGVRYRAAGFALFDVGQEQFAEEMGADGFIDVGEIRGQTRRRACLPLRLEPRTHFVHVLEDTGGRDVTVHDHPIGHTSPPSASARSRHVWRIMSSRRCTARLVQPT